MINGGAVYIENMIYLIFNHTKRFIIAFLLLVDKAASKSIAQYAVSSSVSYLAALGMNGEDKFNKAYPQEKSGVHQ